MKNQMSEIITRPGVVLIALLLLLSPVLYIHILHNPSHAPRSALLSLVAILSSAGFFYSKIKSNDYYFYAGKIHILVLLFLFWAMFSIAWTVDYGNLAFELIPLWGLVILFFISSQYADFTTCKLFISVSVAGASYAAIVGLLQNYGINPLEYRPLEFNMMSTFAYKNHAALYLDQIFPIALISALISNGRVMRWVLSGAAAIILGFLLESHTRGSWLTLVVWLTVIIFYIAWKRKSNKNLIGHLWQRKWQIITILFIATSIFIIPGNIDKNWERTAKQGQTLDDSSRHRVIFYKNSLNIIKEHPVTGAGYGAFWKAFRLHMNHPEIIDRSDERLYLYRLHSDPLQTFVELGIPGGLLSIMIVLVTLFMAFKLLLKLQSSEEKLLVVGLLSGFLACVIHSMIDFPLHKPSSAIQFWVTMGLIAGLYLRKNSEPVRFRFPHISVALIIIGLYVIFAPLFHWQHLQSNYYHRQAILEWNANNCNGALKNINRAVEVGNYYPPTHIERVNIHVSCNKNPQDIFKTLNEELMWDDTNTQALIYRGYIYLNNGYFDLAEQDFKRAVYILPHRPVAKMGLAKTYIKSGQLNQAKELLEKIRQDNPDYAPAEKLLMSLKE